MADCCCGSALDETQCCLPLHRARACALTAEALMRSRYAAYCRGEVDYLVDSQSNAKLPPADAAALRDYCASMRWHSLRILQSRGGAGDTRGEVEFVAFFDEAGQPAQLHERSRFIRERGQWRYLDGDKLKALSLGRNDRCWCGSGKKMKHCHPGS